MQVDYWLYPAATYKKVNGIFDHGVEIRSHLIIVDSAWNLLYERSFPPDIVIYRNLFTP